MRRAQIKPRQRRENPPVNHRTIEQDHIAQRQRSAVEQGINPGRLRDPQARRCAVIHQRVTHVRPVGKDSGDQRKPGGIVPCFGHGVGKIGLHAQLPFSAEQNANITGSSQAISDQSTKGSRSRIVSSRSGLVETRATGVSISSCTRWTYLIALAGNWAKLRAPAVVSCQPSISS